MKTLIINGSPKGERGNSHIFASHFCKGAGDTADLTCIIKEDYKTLAETMEQYDTIIFIMPLYVHAMPGIVMKLLEQIRPLEQKHRAMGFIIQSGFTEPAQSQYARRYFELVCERLNYRYLGTVIKGGSAGVYLMSDGMNKKLFAGMEELGRFYRQNGSFSETVRMEFERNYKFTKGQAGFNQLLHKAGIGDLFWNHMLKKNRAHKERYARPFKPV